MQVFLEKKDIAQVTARKDTDLEKQIFYHNNKETKIES